LKLAYVGLYTIGLTASQLYPFLNARFQCTMNGATTIANIVVAINAIRKSRSRVIFISKS